MPRRSGKRKKTRTHHLQDTPKGATVLTDKGSQESLDKDSEVPRSIVAKGSKVIPQVGELVRDLRKLMGPHTASNLREKSYNRLKDYSEVAAQLGVSHLLTVTQTTRNIVLRIGKTPGGPTLHFRVVKYSLARQVRAAQKRPFESPGAFMTAPLVVLNNFGQAEEQHVKLMRVTFQHMFPSINVKTVRLSDCRRVVLFHYRKEDGTVEMRHYAIRAAPVGINRNIKKILQSKIPNLGDLQDVSQFLEGGGGGGMSDSEGEDASARVVLPDQFLGKGNSKAQQSAMKLSELGPRMRLELFKVERNVGEGDVLYHKFEEKTAAEAGATKARVEKLKKLKEERKAVQAENVKRKREAEEEKRRAKSDAKRAKYGEPGAEGSSSGAPGANAEGDEDDGEDDDDAGDDDDGGADGDDEDMDLDDEDEEDDEEDNGEEGEGAVGGAYSDSEVDEEFLDESDDEN